MEVVINCFCTYFPGKHRRVGDTLFQGRESLNRDRGKEGQEGGDLTRIPFGCDPHRDLGHGRSKTMELDLIGGEKTGGGGYYNTRGDGDVDTVGRQRRPRPHSPTTVSSVQAERNVVDVHRP